MLGDALEQQKPRKPSSGAARIAAAATAMVMRVAKKSSSPQPVSPKAKSPIYFKAIELNYRLKNKIIT